MKGASRKTKSHQQTITPSNNGNSVQAIASALNDRSSATVEPAKKEESKTKPESPTKEQGKRSHYPAPDKIVSVSRSTPTTNSIYRDISEVTPKAQDTQAETTRDVRQSVQPGAVAYAGIGRDESMNRSSAATNEEYLVQASPVDDEPSDVDPDLVDAEAMPPSSPGKNKRRKVKLTMMVVIGSFFVGAVIAGILFGVVFNGDDSGSSPVSQDSAAPFNFTASPTMSPSFSPTLSPSMSPSFPKGPQEYVDRLIELLPDFSTRVIEQDERRSGPQARALHWLAMDENFESYDDEALIQRFALATFYHATDGPSWTDSGRWLRYTDDCTWFNQPDDLFFTGSTCVNRKRTGLFLQNNNLGGSLPPEVGLLTNLENLALNNNQIGGQIPSEVGLLTNLISGRFTLNDWTGTIPTTFGFMTELQWLDMGLTSMLSK